MNKELIDLLETQAKDIESIKTFLTVTEIGNKEALALLKQLKCKTPDCQQITVRGKE